jgi:hypothetical protein
LISGTVNCELSNLSVKEATPPEEQILIWSAPAIMSFRATLRHASTPSTVAPSAECAAGVIGQQVAGSSGLDVSPCPPVWDMTGPPWKSLGPGMSHCSVAFLKCRLAPPTSRTVVNPRESIPGYMSNAHST